MAAWWEPSAESLLNLIFPSLVLAVLCCSGFNNEKSVYKCVCSNLNSVYRLCSSGIGWRLFRTLLSTSNLHFRGNMVRVLYFLKSEITHHKIATHRTVICCIVLQTGAFWRWRSSSFSNLAGVLWYSTHPKSFHITFFGPLRFKNWWKMFYLLHIDNFCTMG